MVSLLTAAVTEPAVFRSSMAFLQFETKTTGWQVSEEETSQVHSSYSEQVDPTYFSECTKLITINIFFEINGEFLNIWLQWSAEMYDKGNHALILWYKNQRWNYDIHKYLHENVLAKEPDVCVNITNTHIWKSQNDSDYFYN